MFGLQVLFQRKRKSLLRLAALLAVGLGGLAIVLPGAGANDGSRIVVADLAGQNALLYPEPISGQHFSAFYSVDHQARSGGLAAFLNAR